MKIQQGLRFKVLASVMGVIFAGCASFEPGLRFQDLHRPRQPTAREIQEGFERSVEEFVTQSKSEMVFDTHLSSNGVLPFLIRIENGGTERYVARRDDIKASLNGQALVP